MAAMSRCVPSRITWMPEADAQAARAAETAARTAYGRLLATLTAQTGDIATAEDALADAFATALRAWPSSGVPDAPEAWLLTTARRRVIDQSRRRETANTASSDLILRLEEAALGRLDPDMPDPRLGLMFLCAHPAIDAAVRTPLMMQTVLGLDAARIASVFLVKPSAMSARLVRAKAKIKAAGIPFGIPGRDAWTHRLGSVLNAVYGAFTAGWTEAAPEDAGGDSLASEAEWLARLLASQLPESGESAGLLALILFCEARRPARTGPDGSYVPLREQDTALWDMNMIGEANDLLRAAAKCDDGGRFQIEAAIQSVHTLRSVTGETDWPVLLSLYDALLRVAPSFGAVIARAAVLGDLGDAAAGLAALDDLPKDRIDAYGPYHATRGHLLLQLGETRLAHDALLRASELVGDGPAKHWLKDRAKAVSPH